MKICKFVLLATALYAIIIRLATARYIEPKSNIKRYRRTAHKAKKVNIKRHAMPIDCIDRRIVSDATSTKYILNYANMLHM